MALSGLNLRHFDFAVDRELEDGLLSGSGVFLYNYYCVISAAGLVLVGDKHYTKKENSNLKQTDNRMLWI